MKAKYGINPISGGEKMNGANDPVTVMPESAMLSATIKCGGAVTCVVSKKEDE